MTEREKISTGILQDSQELKQLILENPDLPLLVFAGEECNSGDYCFMACTSVCAKVGEYLDCMQEIESEHCFSDKNEFIEALENNLCDNFDGSDQEFEAYIKEVAAEYAPYWKKAIIVYVNN